MASGWKEGPAPDRIYVIKDRFEIRYFTSPETFATAIAKDYAPGGKQELVVYQRCEMQADLVIDRLLSEPANAWPDGELTVGFTAEQLKERVKRLKPLLVEILRRL